MELLLLTGISERGWIASTGKPTQVSVMVRVCLQTETAKLGLSNVLVLEISPAEKKRAFSIKFKNYFKPQVCLFF